MSQTQNRLLKDWRTALVFEKAVFDLSSTARPLLLRDITTVKIDFCHLFEISLISKTASRYKFRLFASGVHIGLAGKSRTPVRWLV